MRCDKFKCIYEGDGECGSMGGECIGDMRENFGDCTGCQQLDQDECEGLSNK